jgi:hypothetical protein
VFREKVYQNLQQPRRLSRLNSTAQLAITLYTRMILHTHMTIICKIKMVKLVLILILLMVW